MPIRLLRMPILACLQPVSVYVYGRQEHAVCTQSDYRLLLHIT